MVKIAINGFGRIGRSIFKILRDRKYSVVAINDVHGPEAAAYALRYDSVYGKYNKTVEVKENNLIIDGKKVLVISERDPALLPWKQLGIDVVIESTGAFTSREGAAGHIQAGAKKVIITAPAKQPDCTLVPRVNDEALTKEAQIISVGSCTTNCAATVAKVIIESLGVNYAMLTTVHAYTNDQVILDNPHHNIRRGRAAGLNIIPTTTGAAEAVIEALPYLKDRMTGLSVRVPVACGSLIDLTCEVTRATTKEEVNQFLEKAARGSLKGILSVSYEPLVSSDVIGLSYSAVVDALSTQVDGNLVKILAWYDNEFGYSNRVVDVVERL